MTWKNGSYKPHVLDEATLKRYRDCPCSTVEADLVATIDYWKAEAARLARELAAEREVSPIEELKH